MELSINDWHDWFRLFVMGLCMVILGGLADRFISHRSSWTSKTADYWYAMTMWTITGFVFCGQGIVFDFPLTPGVMVAAAASITTLAGLLKSGHWESDD